MSTTIRTVDVSDYAAWERPDMSRPYEVVSSPAGETIRAHFGSPSPSIMCGRHAGSLDASDYRAMRDAGTY